MALYTIRPEKADVTAGEFVRFILKDISGNIIPPALPPDKTTKILIFDDKIDSDRPYQIIEVNDVNNVTPLDTAGFASGSYKVRWCSPCSIDNRGWLPGICTSCIGSETNNHIADTRFNIISISQRSDVTLHRTASHPTKDQALWAAIRSGTDAISFERYQQFINRLFCGNPTDKDGLHLPGNLGHHLQHGLHDIRHSYHLNVYGAYSYTVLKLATQVFLSLKSGVHINDVDLNEEARRLDMSSVSLEELKQQLAQYISGVNNAVPYLDRIVETMLSDKEDRKEGLPYCYGILQHRLTHPSLIELIWSYWLEEGMLAQTMNAIALRFQNQRSGPNDPLAELEIDPLRPLNNMIWGFVQDRHNLLSVSRRAAEYDHQYGIRLVGRAVPELQSADSRSKFIETFHNLLYRTAIFYREDADTTVIAEAFPLLNALKDVHLLLAEGAHNQYGDLQWTARAEMLSQQWMLARPEMREFLRGRHMVPYQEDWMGAVDAMKKLQGWTDTTISHFHELAVDGERILLSIRFGDWSNLNNSDDNARNWARYWKPEIQRYLYGYLAITGVDMMNDITDSREASTRYLQPSALLQRRLAGQNRQQAALAAAPRRQAIAAPSGTGMAALPRPQQTSRVSSRVRAIKYEQGE